MAAMTDLLLLFFAAGGFALGYLYTSVQADRARHIANLTDQNTWASTADRWQAHAKKVESRLARVEALCLQRCEIELGECRCWFCRVRAAARGGVYPEWNAEKRPTPSQGGGARSVGLALQDDDREDDYGDDERAEQHVTTHRTTRPR